MDTFAETYIHAVAPGHPILLEFVRNCYTVVLPLDLN